MSENNGDQHTDGPDLGRQDLDDQSPQTATAGATTIGDENMTDTNMNGTNMTDDTTNSATTNSATMNGSTSTGSTGGDHGFSYGGYQPLGGQGFGDHTYAGRDYGYPGFGAADNAYQSFGGHDYGYQSFGDPGFDSPPVAAGSEDRSLAALAHASSLIGMLISAGWLSIVGPLGMWLFYKDRSPFIRQAAAASFNFNLSMWLVNAAGWICILTIIGIPLGVLLILGSLLGQIVAHVIGTLRAAKGETMDYPFQLKVLR